MNLIVKMKFGSHLYGTATENSDTDYKGIFLPTRKQVLLSHIPKSINEQTKKGDRKNSAEDIDTEIYSLHHFIKLACEGQTVALDMLHAPKEMILKSSNIWKGLVRHRELFYTRNLKAFIGYARKQASKYGIKGSRLNDAKRVLDFLHSCNESLRLSDVWDELPDGEHIFKLPSNPNGLREYQVCGRKVQESAFTGYGYSIINKFHENYGNRAILAAKNEGIDWKAISHAMRAAFQVKEILTDNTITFPLKDADYLIKVKNGEFDYQTEAAPRLERLMDEVEVLSQESNLPIAVDKEYWDDFVMNTLEDYTFEYLYS